VEAAWRDGLGPDDDEAIARVDRGDPDPELQLFAALHRLASQDRVAVPPAPNGHAAAVVHASAVLIDAARSRIADEAARAVELLDRSLSSLDDHDPRAIAAVAWADLALAEVALAIGDTRAASHRFEAVAQPQRPIALRIAASLQLAGLAIERGDVEAARSWAHRAITLAESADRPRHAVRARLVRALLEYAAGDVRAMRETLAAQCLADDVVPRLLLAMAHHGPHALPALAELLRAAVVDRDPIVYALCVLLGARRYHAIGRTADAIATADAGIAQLANIAPHLANLLAQQRREWEAAS
jgi:hypothetical protein